MDPYVQGFLAKCAEDGIDPVKLLKFSAKYPLKGDWQEIDPGKPPLPAPVGAVGAQNTGIQPTAGQSPPPDRAPIGAAAWAANKRQSTNLLGPAAWDPKYLRKLLSNYPGMAERSGKPLFGGG